MAWGNDFRAGTAGWPARFSTFFAGPVFLCRILLEDDKNFFFLVFGVPEDGNSSGGGRV